MRNRESRFRSVFVLLTSVLVAAIAAFFLVGGPYVTELEIHGDSGPVTVRWLANAGVWIESGSSVVVIDGLYDGTTSGESYRYTNLDDDEARDARAGLGRWQAVDLVLATHQHFDHFDASVVAAHLRANQGAEFGGPPQAADGVRSDLAETPDQYADGALRQHSKRVHGFSPGKDGTGRLERGAIRVTFLDLPHGGAWRGSIENVGLIVEIDGVQILHVGDAATDVALYDELRDEIENVDLFLAPAWYLWEPDGNEVIRSYVSADRVVGIHVSPVRSRWIEWNLRMRWPGVELMGDF